MTQIALASNNQGKIREVKDIFLHTPFTIKSMLELGIDQDIPENGTTFNENAKIKAQTVAEITGLTTIADDSGLAIDALNGEPGVYSKRVGKTNEERINKILHRLTNIDHQKRIARFVSVVCLVNPKTNQTKFFEGKVEGSIATKPIGASGFGYDPIFYSTDLKKTFAQATLAEKQTFSHRAQALKKCITYLKNNPIAIT